MKMDCLIVSEDDYLDEIVTGSECSSVQSPIHITSNCDAQSPHVKFDSIKIREYDMILGDNPSSSSGPPVTIDWDYNELSSVSLDDYEQHRGPRRSNHQMRMNRMYRTQILCDSAGHTEDEILKVKYDCKKIRKQRGFTRLMLPLSKMEEATQSASRKLKRLRNNEHKSMSDEI